MIKVVASEAMEFGRALLVGSGAAWMSNVKVKCSDGEDGSVVVTFTADVEYRPNYIAVIQLSDTPETV